MYRATVTSKGQITIPADVRNALGVGQGDGVVFELKADYAVFRRQPTIDEALSRIAAQPAVGSSLFSNDAEALHSYFELKASDEDLDERVYLCRPGHCVRVGQGDSHGRMARSKTGT